MNSSGVNTILIVVLLLLVVGGGVWYATQMRENNDDSGSLNVDVNLPGTSGSNSGSN